MMWVKPLTQGTEQVQHTSRTRSFRTPLTDLTLGRAVDSVKQGPA